MSERLRSFEERLKRYDRQLEALARRDSRAGRLMMVPGVGPLIATALIAAVGDGRQFKSGRALSAWLGLVPHEHSSGERTILLGISKRGDRYLRTLLIHGARSALRYAPRKADRNSLWFRALSARRGPNIAAVAMANKNARVLWALLTRRRLRGGGINTCPRLRRLFATDGEPVRPALSKPVVGSWPKQAAGVMRRKRADFHHGPEQTKAPERGRIHERNRLSPSEQKPCARGWVHT
jgi:hypothetical protein